MDINKVQQLNNMANELKRHNLMSKEAAIGQAERLYGAENDFSKEAATVQHSNEIDELKKEVRKLSFAYRDLVNEMTETKTKLGKLEQELSDARVGQSMRRTVSAENSAAPAAPARTLGGNAAQKIEAMQQASAEIEAKRENSKPIDRNNVAPKDVTIDKFFYCGTNR